MPHQTLRYSGTDSTYRWPSDDNYEGLLGVTGFNTYLATRTRDFTEREWVARRNSQKLTDFGYIGLTSTRRRAVMVVDCDDEYDHARLAAFGVTPNWIGINRDNGHSQYIYYLENPVYRDARVQYTAWNDTDPVKFYNAVGRGLNAAQGGDPQFARGLSRNPMSKSKQYEWHFQHGIPTTLEALRDAVLEVIPPSEDGEVRLPNKQRATQKSALRTFHIDGTLHRYWFLWDVGRFEGYRIRKTGALVEYNGIRAVLDPANAEIAFTDPRGGRSEKDLHGIASSVTNWCNTSMKAGSGAGEKWDPIFTKEQCSLGGKNGGPKGGKTQGTRNVESGHLQRLSLDRSVKKVVRDEEIRMMKAAPMTCMEIMAATGLSEAKVRSVKLST